MARTFRIWQIIAGIAVLASTVAGCTIKDTQAPPLQGPSEFALSFQISAVPDVLSQDGASQSQIFIQTRDANGQPKSGVNFRADMVVSGVMADFGTLSARSLVTDANGRASVIYTAPRAVSPQDTGQTVTIQITPLSTDFANSVARNVLIRLIPPGVLLPGGPQPKFTVAPTTPTAFSEVTFDASTSTAAPSTLLVDFAWDFGDGDTGNGVTVFHRFAAGSYVVRLTVTDTNGVFSTVSQSINVGAGAVPTAAFTFSPSSPGVNQDIFFSGATSIAGLGRTIVRYDWTFGSGAPRSGISVTKQYDTAGTYAVVLTVTDDVGQTGVATQNVAVGSSLPTPSITFSPASPGVNQPVFFNGQGSTTPAGTTITSYDWNFGDGATGSGATPSHTYTTAASHLVRLTVTNSANQTGTTTTTVTVGSPGTPTASFTTSPTTPLVGQTVNFNASSSTGNIVRYDWDFGDGFTDTRATATTTHAYAVAGGYLVRLTVTDSSGNRDVATQTVSVTNPAPPTPPTGPTADFVFSPAPASAGVPINFTSTSTQGTAAITTYTWSWGDGLSCPASCGTGTAPFAAASHTYPLVAPSGTVVNYNVILTVRDGNGLTSTKTVSVPVTTP